ncbi:hypothetical protein J1614_000901 [Plenodomus biglobosus]|nr:hypothetical protein J1614_000901 [Plenodomus biglobosus]
MTIKVASSWGKQRRSTACDLYPVRSFASISLPCLDQHIGGNLAVSGSLIDKGPNKHVQPLESASKHRRAPSRVVTGKQ